MGCIARADTHTTEASTEEPPELRVTPRGHGPSRQRVQQVSIRDNASFSGEGGVGRPQKRSPSVPGCRSGSAIPTSSPALQPPGGDRPPASRASFRAWSWLGTPGWSPIFRDRPRPPHVLRGTWLAPLLRVAAGTVSGGEERGGQFGAAEPCGFRLELARRPHPQGSDGPVEPVAARRAPANPSFFSSRGKNRAGAPMETSCGKEPTVAPASFQVTCSPNQGASRRVDRHNLLAASQLCAKNRLICSGAPVRAGVGQQTFLVGQPLDTSVN
jgi:hypothetical protein